MNTWLTKEGKVIKVCEMSTSHVKNCLKMLEKNNNEYTSDDIGMLEEEIEHRTRIKTVLKELGVIND